MVLPLFVTSTTTVFAQKPYYALISNDNIEKAYGEPTEDGFTRVCCIFKTPVVFGDSPAPSLNMEFEPFEAEMLLKALNQVIGGAQA